MPTFSPQDQDGSASSGDLAPVGAKDGGGIARAIGALVVSGIAFLRSIARIESGDGAGHTANVDSSGSLNVAQGTKAAFADAWPTVPTDAAGNAYSSQLDAGVRRLEIAGKVSVIGAAPPPSTNDATIFADTPLVVTTHDTTFVVPTGETFHLQEIIIGNEDPTKGCVVEVLFDDGTEHLVGRAYGAGFTIREPFPDTTIARDGTTMVGNGTNTIVVRRTRYAGSAIAIDAEVRGYTT